MARATLAFLVLVCLARADEVEMTDGRIIEGKVQDLGHEVRITQGRNSITFPKSMVKKITYKPTKEEDYETRKKEVKDKDGHLRLARWCKDVGLKDAAREQYLNVVESEPDNEEAREYLGHRKFEGRWMSEEEIMQAQGYVKHKGRWMTPEERDVEVELDKAKEIEKKLAADVRKYIQQLASKDSKKQDEAKASLGAIDAKFKTKPFIGAVSHYSKQVRLYVVSELRDPSAVPALVRAQLFDQEKEVREAAFSSIKEIQHPDTALHYVKGLYSEYRSVRRRAMDGLTSFKDLRAAPYLVALLERLQNQLKTPFQMQSQYDTVVNRPIQLPDGSQMMLPKRMTVQSPQEDEEEKKKVEEETGQVVATLKSITGQDFGDSPAKWRAWLAGQKK